VFIVDDPTRWMGIADAQVIASMIDKLAKKGKTVIVASNDDLLNHHADQIFHLSRGHLVRQTHLFFKRMGQSGIS
jgi:ABC-type cobalamin transport system ATPase subunit